MENAVSAQLQLFLQSILLGGTAGLVYDLLRALLLHRPRLTPLLDSLYCVLLGMGLLRFALRRGAGELRIFVLLGLLGGAVLYFSGCAPFFRPIWAFWAETLEDLRRLLRIPLDAVEKLVQ